jgi:hypothetical protein
MRLNYRSIIKKDKSKAVRLALSITLYLALKLLCASILAIRLSKDAVIDALKIKSNLCRLIYN